METLTASLERSMQICSLDHTTAGESSAVIVSSASVLEISSSSSDASLDLPSLSNNGNSDSSSCSDSVLVELNSFHLPYHWEQCLDLKTGEIYYMNWKNGMKTRQDPRLPLGNSCEEVSHCYLSEDEDVDLYNEEVSYENSEYEGEDDDLDDCTSDDSSDGDFSMTSSAMQETGRSSRYVASSLSKLKREDVLVVSGCRSCLMYYMLPRHARNCPRCNGDKLLRFD